MLSAGDTRVCIARLGTRMHPGTSCSHQNAMWHTRGGVRACLGLRKTYVRHCMPDITRLKGERAPGRP